MQGRLYAKGNAAVDKIMCILRTQHATGCQTRYDTLLMVVRHLQN